MISRGRLTAMLGFAAIVLLGVIGLGLLPRLKKQQVLAADAAGSENREGTCAPSGRARGEVSKTIVSKPGPPCTWSSWPR